MASTNEDRSCNAPRLARAFSFISVLPGVDVFTFYVFECLWSDSLLIALSKSARGIGLPFGPSIHWMHSTIHGALALPGNMAHHCRDSLPYLTMPVWFVRSWSSFAFASLKPRLRRSVLISSGVPVRNVQPGLMWWALTYSFNLRGVSSSGLSVIEYMKISFPTRSPNRFWTFLRFIVMGIQMPSHFTYMKLSTTILSLIKSS